MTTSLLSHLQQLQKQVPTPPVVAAGKLVRGIGLTLEAVGCQLPVGSQCMVQTVDGEIEAEVVGFGEHITYLMPTEAVRGIVPGSRVLPLNRESGLAVGLGLLGRVIDGNGQPLDGLGPVESTTRVPTVKPPINPLTRRPIDSPMDVGVRAINALNTVGIGQRMGLFAGSGVGKSVLLGMMTRGAKADVVVVGLVGERGREVKEFIHDILTPEERERAVVVAAPADTSPLMRLKGCETAVTVAEYFRDQGMNVLLLIDSLTRYAMAQREIALAVGEPPATKGYPPSVFARLPALVERAGNGSENQGSITAFYTVLTEGDDLQDPIADAARAILDGHIVLSRQLADSGHYPAIDIEASISRVMPQVVSEEHLMQARRVRQVYSTYQQNKDLITLGAYTRGTDPRVDLAINAEPAINALLQQGMKQVLPYDESLASMAQLAGGLGKG
ncbi:flagellum-specific ATP synthase [Marisediminitalea aggregata]|jgi:flagellum-specific ATP synthase|uniref:Flagellum-specific ATP synthase n=1 Tax=Marisediminitalea aggregata TaxID=634436 RepID=A0A1M5GN04_9ALTE|nr:flagellar protein export ATPase FliI [Marisediminitalea aggregata]MAP23499.1 flagellum-specific ATP synthase FliI [Alteromonadaceae bacterium]MCP4527140.1 flagellar protein export ATPase FliI [Aestuariibacter sp.]MEC7469965.1 flagellar protein export ATPase FliI [Pseudomonadota bacterium]HBY39372.1 flagellar protein export ATPase FliI [Alteromonas sp.]MAX41859.1 flagellum-specific ATP synthase FliI [Alteromonadaceae bacterium]|tara:strand:- start:35055 stop:36389 length:1335 start_codon:yes stop_codon:yes gene_type:complete